MSNSSVQLFRLRSSWVLVRTVRLETREPKQPSLLGFPPPRVLWGQVPAEQNVVAPGNTTLVVDVCPDVDESALGKLCTDAPFSEYMLARVLFLLASTSVRKVFELSCILCRVKQCIIHTIFKYIVSKSVLYIGLCAA